VRKTKFDAKRNAQRIALWNDIGTQFILYPLRVKHCIQLKW
jgi:hypothetical protein